MSKLYQCNACGMAIATPKTLTKCEVYMSGLNGINLGCGSKNIKEVVDIPRNPVIVGWDEASEFTEAQMEYLQGRQRKEKGNGKDV